MIGNDRVFLALSDVHAGTSTRSRRGELWSVHARLVLPHLTAETQVHLSDSASELSLVGYFADLATDWRGWSGARTWATYEGGLALSGDHDGLGHLRISVELRERSSDGWLVRGDVPLDAGKLDQLPKDLAAFFG